MDYSKFEAFVDDKIIVTEKFKFVLGRMENIVGKGENAGYQHFLLSPQFFPKLSFLKGGESQDCVVRSLNTVKENLSKWSMSKWLDILTLSEKC